MSTTRVDYFVHIEDIKQLRLRVYKYVNKLFDSHQPVSIEDLAKIGGAEDTVFILLPGNLVNSFYFSRNDGEKNTAFENRFCDQKGEMLVHDFSKQKFVEYKQKHKVYLLDQKILDAFEPIIKGSLVNVEVFPENFLLAYEDSFNAFNCFGRFLVFTEAADCYSSFMSQKLFLLKKLSEQFPDMVVKSYTDTFNKKLAGSSDAEHEALCCLHKNVLVNFKGEFPQFVKRTININGLKKFLVSNKKSLFVYVTVILLALLLPTVNTTILDFYQSKYTGSTLDLLKKVDPKATQLINVKAQFNASTSNTLSMKGASDIKHLDLLRRLDRFSGYFESIEMNSKSQVIRVVLKNKPDFKFKMLINWLKNQDGILNIDTSLQDERVLSVQYKGLLYE